MNIFQTIILSAVEGISEFLPISSTGHLILAAEILKIEQTEFVKSFEIIIQLGAILAVVFIYYKTMLNKKIWPQILISFLPSAVVGFILYKFIKEYLIGNSLVVVIALFIGGIIFILIELWQKNKIESEGDLESISIKNAFLIGLFQSISVIPGVSRSGASIMGARLLGLNKKNAAEFSFILAVPTIFGATVLDISQTKLNYSSNDLFLLLIGFIGSFIFAFISIKWLIKYLQNHNFIIFGIYRIVLAVIFYVIFIL